MNIAYFSCAVLALSLTGCQFWRTPQINNTNATPNTNNNYQTTQTYWLDYNLKQCETAPWGATLEPDTISAYYADLYTMDIFAIEVMPPREGFLTCAACGCPTGTVVSIQTDAAGRNGLLDEGFTEAKADAEASTLSESPDAAMQAQANVNNTTITDTITVDATTADETVDDNLTPEDAQLRQEAERVEIALAEYYREHGSYPETLQSLNLEIDVTAFTYTPIGSLPAVYYDLVIFYSTGAITVNP